MKRHSGKVYPNGAPKSRLLEIYLSYRDFNCTPEQYWFDLTAVRKSETDGIELCFWREDDNGRKFVDGLTLADECVACEVTQSGFQLVPMTHRVFISYAKEDAEHARRLYAALKILGIRSWLDEENLLPGQQWAIEIESEIAISTHFIALLSSRSVAKKGYVQREIRTALDVLQRLPERKIFLIPARLDACDPAHSALSNIQRVDMFPDWDKGMRKIIKALKI